jgi:hypothetical protein
MNMDRRLHDQIRFSEGRGVKVSEGLDRLLIRPEYPLLLSQIPLVPTIIARYLEHGRL